MESPKASGRYPQRRACGGGGPYGEIVSSLKLPFPRPHWERQGGGGEARLGGRECGATVTHFRLLQLWGGLSGDPQTRSRERGR